METPTRGHGRVVDLSWLGLGLKFRLVALIVLVISTTPPQGSQGAQRPVVGAASAANWQYAWKVPRTLSKSNRKIKKRQSDPLPKRTKSTDALTGVFDDELEEDEDDDGRSSFDLVSSSAFLTVFEQDVRILVDEYRLELRDIVRRFCRQRRQ